VESAAKGKRLDRVSGYRILFLTRGVWIERKMTEGSAPGALSIGGFLHFFTHRLWNFMGKWR
jgi:hypothetical protein